MLLNIRIETKNQSVESNNDETHIRSFLPKMNFQKTRPYLQEVIYMKKFIEHNKITDSREKEKQPKSSWH